MINSMTNAPINELSTASTSELRGELARALDITSKHLIYLASIWHELEDRGEDLTDLRHGIAAYLPLIANQKINASLVVKYAGQKTLLGALSQLPIDIQNRISESGYVTVVKSTGDRYEEIETPLSKLAASDIYKVFSEQGERSPAEQIKLLTKKPRKKKSHFRRARRVQLNVQDKSITVGSTSVDIAKLIPLLSEFYKKDIKVFLENGND